MAAPCCKVNTVLNYRSLELSCGVSARLSTTRFAIERADCLNSDLFVESSSSEVGRHGRKSRAAYAQGLKARA